MIIIRYFHIRSNYTMQFILSDFLLFRGCLNSMQILQLYFRLHCYPFSLTCVSSDLKVLLYNGSTKPSVGIQFGLFQVIKSTTQACLSNRRYLHAVDEYEFYHYELTTDPESACLFFLHTIHEFRDNWTTLYHFKSKQKILH